MKTLLKNQRFALIPALFLQLLLPARAIIINPTYDTSVTSSTNSAQIQAAFNTAAQYLENLYTNNSSLNVTVILGNTSLGQSSFSYYPGFAYADVTNALHNLRNTAAASNAVASLPPNDPTTTDSWGLLTAQIKAMGLAASIGLAATDSVSSDGSITFANNVTFTFDPTNRAVAGKYDFIGVALHEMTEVMGRVNLGLTTDFTPYDLFRFTNNGARSLINNAPNAYFSFDNGATAMRYFWTNSNQGDVQDWLPSGPADSYDYAISAGKKSVLSYADLEAVGVIGYQLNYSPPKMRAVRQSTNFVLSFTNTPGTTYTLLTTTNLSLAVSNWTTLGTVTDTVPGQFQFTDATAGTNKLRFYRVRLN